jgi:hypothetical protein
MVDYLSLSNLWKFDTVTEESVEIQEWICIFEKIFILPSGWVYRPPLLVSYYGNNFRTEMLAQHARSAVSCMLVLEYKIRN